MKRRILIYLVLQVIVLIRIESRQLTYFKIHSCTQSKPEITCSVGHCEAAKRNINTGICYGHLNINAKATDHCNTDDKLFWEYQIDLNNDSKGIYNGYDLKVSRLSKNEYAQGILPTINDNIFADKSAYPFDASGTYPLGTHRICWTIENTCGDKESCCTIFEIKDCQAPTPYCLTGLIMVPIKISGCVDIWAKDLDNGSFDNCSSSEKLKFFFDGDPNKSKIQVCCEDFIKAGVGKKLTVELEFWVEDEEGNRDFCRTTIVVTDEFHICPSDPPMYSIIGQVIGENNELLSNVEINLFKNGSLIQSLNNNPFNFPFLGYTMNNIYEVLPRRNDDHLNGVSTADIIKIQRHVLGKTKLNSPYLLLAADVNDSKSITSADISEIRKLVLGITEEFSKVNSWRIIPENYKFSDPEFPFDAPRSKKFTSNLKFIDTADFIGIKMGDVTGNARAGNFKDKIFERQNSNVNLYTKQLIDKSSNRVLVHFYLNTPIAVHGIQLGFHFNNQLLEWINFKDGTFNIEEENISDLLSSDGAINLSWNCVSPVKITSDEPLFSFIFERKDIFLDEYQFHLRNSVTESEIYDENVNAFQLYLENRISKNYKDNKQYLSNPWIQNDKIHFTLLNSESKVDLIVYDQLGKRIYSEFKNGEEGLNFFEIERSKFTHSGIYYFEIITSMISKSGKMLILN